MYYNIHFLVAYYRVHALLTRKDRRGRASTDGTPRDWTDRDIKSLRPFRPDPSPPKVELWKRGLALALMVIVAVRSEEHTSEIQSLMRISYAVFCLKKKKTNSPRQLQTEKQQNNQTKNQN